MGWLLHTAAVVSKVEVICSVDEVMEEDRLTVIPRPKRGVDPEQPQEKKVCDVFTCTITCAGVQRACSSVLVMMAKIIDRCTKVAIL